VLQIFNKEKGISEVLKAVTMNILAYWVKILYRLFDWRIDMIDVTGENTASVLQVKLLLRGEDRIM
jgi:hypothetical protein